MKKLLFLTIGVFFLSGCAARVHYGLGAKMSPEKAATLKPSKAKSPWFPSIASYRRVDSDSKEWNEVGNYWVGYPSSLRLLPGTYAVMFLCSSGATYAYPTGVFKADESKTYTSRCFKAVGGKVGVEIVEYGKEHADNAQKSD